MTKVFRNTCVYLLSASLASLASPIVVQAEVIGTLAGLEAGQRDADLAKIHSVMAREEVREKMRALGVDDVQVESRLAALTDSELHALAQNMDSAPAGGVLEVIGATFLVLLILEAVGVIDIFKKFP